MNRMHKKILFIVTLTAMLFFTACATKIKPSTSMNPPPSKAFMNFTAFEMKPLCWLPHTPEMRQTGRLLQKYKKIYRPTWPLF